ncbi:MAG: peptidylprolyl isomerase [Burkholderiales bacterium]
MRGWICALSLVAVALPAMAQDKLPAGVVARMGDTELRVDELKAILDALGPEAKAQLAQAPAELNRIVRAELLRKSLGAEARAKGWDKRPEVVTQLDRAREQALVASYMNSVAKPPESYPAESDIRAAYDQSQNAFTVPKQYRLAQIFVLAPPESDKGATAKAQAKLNDLSDKARKKGADFAALAKTGSEHAESAAKGGDMGWVAEANLIPELREPVSAMKKGDISAPIKTTQGWHVLRLEDIREKGVRPLTEVRDQIAAALRMRRAQETEQAYLTFMTNKTPVSISDAELAKVQGGLK